MTNEGKIRRIKDVSERIEKLMDGCDFGEQTEYLDRALDQLNYAQHEIEAEIAQEDAEVKLERF